MKGFVTRHRFDPALLMPLWVTSGLMFVVAAEVLYLVLTEGLGAPSGSEGGVPKAVHLCFMTFVLTNTIGNIIQFIKNSPTISGVFLSRDGVGQGWMYCYSCETHVPSRCFHCPDCNVCVLRRDHHCVFYGQCVGHRNYRYFLCALLYTWVALLYAMVLNMEVFLAIIQEGVTLRTVLMLIMPWLMFMTGQVSPSAFLFAFVADTCVVGFLFVSTVLALHAYLSSHGQTTREWLANNHQYDLGWQQNLQEALGERWYLVWIFPFITSPLPGDGVSFKRRPDLAQLPAKQFYP
uniref:Palmitoyltransferase n=1 Tax=Latimeria chalumnae TaxID=7897 RepID=H3BDY5_LATCH